MVPRPADVDWVKLGLLSAEWAERDRRRKNRYLANYRELNGWDHTRRPWAGLGDTKASLDGCLGPAGVDAGEFRATSSGRGSCTARLNSEGRLHTASSRSSRAPSSMGPPRTSSTGLSSLWHRALSTPQLPSATNGASEEAWRCQADREDLARLVGQVHDQVVEQRTRRRRVEEMARSAEERATPHPHAHRVEGAAKLPHQTATPAPATHKRLQSAASRSAASEPRSAK
mmetsp:Transcript_52359/g.113464  ORF Transcript_52359/g.113464 Transcript_52359/m.113464 type:complete len:229 (+) Transcript_52359:37-723(+)